MNKDKNVNVRITAVEHQAIKIAARRDGRSMGEYMRQGVRYLMINTALDLYNQLKKSEEE